MQQPCSLAATAIALSGALAVAQSNAAVTPTATLRLSLASAHGDEPPAIAWLRDSWLNTQLQWPGGHAAAAGCSLHWTRGALAVAAALPLPDGVTLAGEATVGGVRIEFACERDGREQWRVTGSDLPTIWQAALAAMQLGADGNPRTIDVAALTGHFAGATAGDDPRAQQLLMTGVQCGEATLVARAQGSELVVTGRSGGGLLVPALVLALALEQDGSTTLQARLDSWRLRAFGSRDGDRAEAVRQLQRGGTAALPTLRALLWADETSRLAAIDGLLRLQAAGELPQIVAAAVSEMPLVALLARAAVRELWPLASAPTRARTLAALRTSRTLDVSILPPAVASRARWLGLLGVATLGLFGLWVRERTRFG